MKAFLIDPHTQTVTEIDITDGRLDMEAHLEDMYKALDCDIVEVGGYISDLHKDCVFVDEEGLLGDLNEQRFFVLGIYDNEQIVTLAGKGLVMGGDDEGNSIEPVSTLEEIKKIVKFVSNEEIGVVST